MENKHNKIINTTSQVTIVSGAGASGKSHLSLFTALKAAENPNTYGVIFVKDRLQLSAVGGLLDKAKEVFNGLAIFNAREQKFKFTNGSEIYLCYSGSFERLKQNHTNQYSFIAVDNAENFTKQELMYLLSRLRSTHTNDLKCFWFASPDKNSCLHGLLSNACIDKDGYVIESTNELFINSDFELHNEGNVSVNIFSMTVDDNEGFQKEKEAYTELLKLSLDKATYTKIRYGCWK